MAYLEKRKDKYLQAARMLSQKIHATDICKELRLSGRDIGNVKTLMDKGYITLDEKDRPMFARPLEEAEEFIKQLRYTRMGKPPPPTPAVSAAKAVEDVIKKETAKEATERTAQYMEIGKKVAGAYWRWAQKMGIPIEEAVKHDISKIVSEALNFHAKGQKLEARVRELEDVLRLAAQEVDPVLRLKNACIMVYKFLEFATLAEIVGFDIEGSPIISHYQKMIEGYLRGEYA